MGDVFHRMSVNQNPIKLRKRPTPRETNSLRFCRVEPKTTRMTPLNQPVNDRLKPAHFLPRARASPASLPAVVEIPAIPAVPAAPVVTPAVPAAPAALEVSPNSSRSVDKSPPQPDASISSTDPAVPLAPVLDPVSWPLPTRFGRRPRPPDRLNL